MQYETLCVQADTYKGELTCYEHVQLGDIPEVARPAILVLPGGGYGFCSDREGEPIAAEFFNRGYNAYVLKYPLAPVRYPAQLCVAAKAMDMIRKRASGCNTDPHRVYACGFSAGGHLCGCLANCPDTVRQVQNYNFRPDAVVLSYAVLGEQPGHKGSYENLLGDMPRTPDLAWLELVNSVRDDNPPAFIWHTAADTCVAPIVSLRYAEKYCEKGLRYELHIYPYGEHGMATVDKRTNNYEIDPAVARAARWIDEADAFLRSL
ncbi:MAG: alpha/beta hydrolase [Clostridiales bacterium]|nr:alpha/beta hydrolase [Clostridiales bacterium]